jgi:polyhydroxybutyrate depolymerase
VHRRLPILAVALFVVFALGGCKRHTPHPRTSDVHLFSPHAPRTPEPTAGCSAATPHVTAPGASLTISGRALRVYTPRGWDGARPLPLVFAFHGWGGTATSFQSWMQLEEFVGDAVVVYPEAVRGYWDIRGERDLALFDAAVSALAQSTCIDRARVFAFGFSHGGHFVHYLGCERSSALRAIAIGDGSL